jgi:hypothetical protein
MKKPRARKQPVFTEDLAKQWDEQGLLRRANEPMVKLWKESTLRQVWAFCKHDFDDFLRLLRMFSE